MCWLEVCSLCIGRSISRCVSWGISWCVSSWVLVGG